MCFLLRVSALQLHLILLSVVELVLLAFGCGTSTTTLLLLCTFPPRPATPSERECVQLLLRWLDRLLAQLPARTTPIIFLDANTHFGSPGQRQVVVDRVVGPLQPAKETWSAPHLRHVLSNHNFVLANNYLHSRIIWPYMD